MAEKTIHDEDNPSSHATTASVGDELILVENFPLLL